MHEEVQTPIKRWYKRRWFIVTLVVLAVISVVSAVIAGIIFVLWTTSPEKVLLEAAKNATTTPAVYQVKSDTIDASVTFKPPLVQVNGKLDGLQIDVIIDNDTVYIKTPDPARVYALLPQSKTVDTSIQPLVTTALESVKNKWIRIDTSQLIAQPTAPSDANCVVTAKNFLQSNPRAEKDFAKAYISNRFLTIDSSGHSQYALSIDQQKLHSFIDYLTKSTSYKSIAGSCTQFLQTVRKMNTGDAKTLAVISQPENLLQSLVVTEASGQEITIKADYDNVPAITIPDDSVSYGQIASSVLQTYLRSFIGNR